MELPSRIRLIREKHGLTQADIAEKCNITPSAYGQIERNATRATFETLVKIALALEVSISYLLDIDCEP